MNKEDIELILKDKLGISLQNNKILFEPRINRWEMTLRKNRQGAEFDSKKHVLLQSARQSLDQVVYIGLEPPPLIALPAFRDLA